LHEEIHDLYCAPNIIKVIKMRMRWMGHVAHMGEVKGERKRAVKIPKHRWAY